MSRRTTAVNFFIFVSLYFSFNEISIISGLSLKNRKIIDDTGINTRHLFTTTNSNNRCINEIIDRGRRKLIATPGSLIFGCALYSSINPERANAAASSPSSAAEAIRLSASKIPGYGPSDVYFPKAFLGKWKATRTIVTSAELPNRSSPIVIPESILPLKIEYDVRFLTSIAGDGESVVADRGYNEVSFVEALGAAIRDGGTSLVRSSEWTPSNPNDLRLSFADGCIEDIKVTKRATEKTIDTVSSSEFRRIVREGGSSGGGSNMIPSITAERALQKWKVVGEGRALEGIEIVYDAGGTGIGDPMKLSLTAGLGGSPSVPPRILIKSRIVLNRL